MVDFDLNHFRANYFDLIYKSFFSLVIYDFDLNKKNSVISYNTGKVLHYLDTVGGGSSGHVPATSFQIARKMPNK